MKLKTIASIFKKNKRLILHTAKNGDQWISNGVSMYSLRGMPKLTTEIVLRIFDVPPDKFQEWQCQTSEMPTVIDFGDSILEETDIDPWKLHMNWHGDTYKLFSDMQRIYTVKSSYISPLLDDADYMTYHQRKTSDGAFVLAVKIGFELKAIIMPAYLHNNKDFTAEIIGAAAIYKRITEEADQIQEAPDEVYTEDGREIDTETGEIIGQKSMLDE